MVPTNHPRIYLSPNRDRLTTALGANTVAARRFKSSVDSWMNGGDLWGFPAWNAALMGQLSSSPQYCAAAIADTDAMVTTAEAAVASGNAPEVARDSYLYIGEEVGGLALVYDWCFDTLTSAQRSRWVAFADQAVWNVWHHETAKWGNATIPWTGWSVDNPSNNYYYSFLRATMLLGLATKNENPNADAWLAKFDDKVKNQLVPTYEADLQGGGSREGTGYGVAMRRLFELY
ncbi:MAG: hypothetical protein H0T79_22400, partial [Deltaproteobacteria bacterium]|nr:hypothetical protein [Deltaproteobacteria bacterium]